MAQMTVDREGINGAAKVEVYHGDEMCREKSKLLLREVGLPSGLLPLQDMVECGYVEETGYVWLKQKQKVEHVFEKIGRKVSFAPEISAYVEKSRIRKLTGVKAKELLVWLTVTDISAVAEDEPATSSSGKLTFKTSTGLLRTFPSSAFELVDGEGDGGAAALAE